MEEKPEENTNRAKGKYHQCGRKPCREYIQGIRNKLHLLKSLGFKREWGYLVKDFIVCYREKEFQLQLLTEVIELSLSWGRGLLWDGQFQNINPPRWFKIWKWPLFLYFPPSKWTTPTKNTYTNTCVRVSTVKIEPFFFYQIARWELWRSPLRFQNQIWLSLVTISLRDKCRSLHQSGCSSLFF